MPPVSAISCFFIFFLHFLRGISSAPSTIKIGGLLDPGSSLGRSCLVALQLAVKNVNADPSILHGTTLELVYANTDCDPFVGASAAILLFQSEVVAIAGPQSSSVAHFLSHMAAHTHVPLVSFAATDPALSEFQFPYFTRVAWSDSVQMSAVAAIIQYYGWRDIVVLFVDNDYGKNGVDILGDHLEKVGSRIVYKAGFDAAADSYTIGGVLARLEMMESRVFVVHMQPAMARIVFLVASYLRMMTDGYVWIVTDAIVSSLDSTTNIDMEFEKAAWGVIGTRMHIPDQTLPENKSSTLVGLYLDQRNQETGRTDYDYNAYELLAYDAIWTIAHAIDKFLQQGNSFNFTASSFSANMSGGNSDLAKLKILSNGDILLKNIRATNFTGITGLIQIDENGDAKGISFEIVNRVCYRTGKDEIHAVGYWSNENGCTSTPPSLFKGEITLRNNTGKLLDVYWPGCSITIPRGWVVPKNGSPLTIGVPNKTGYEEFVDVGTNIDGKTTFRGFCIDVFEAAVKYLPYAVTYNFVSFGNGSTTPDYDVLIEKIVTKEFDAVVGDVAITTARAKLVDFTQPYTTSGLMIVAPMKGESGSHVWAFLSPFTAAMWFTTCAFFLLTGFVIWLLEHKKNRDFRGRPKKQLVTTLWFIFSTLFFSQRENVKSTLGRAVLVIWLFVVLIVTSSYTASLTSILTVQKLSPAVQGIAGLVSSNFPIGYQAGSFVEEFLLQLNIPKERLVQLDSLSSYAIALRKGPHNGGVGAIVDELPYLQLFLKSECDFSMVGEEFTESGWGFAFHKGSELAVDLSTAILELSQNGQLQEIHDLWLNGYACSSEMQVQSNELNLSSFWGLFLITGVTSFVCVVFYFIRMIWQYNKLRVHEPLVESSDGGGDQQIASRFRRGASFLKSLASFIEEAEIDNNYRRGSRKYRSGRMTVSEKSIESSNRDSLVSADGTHTELRELIKELSSTFKNRISDGIVRINESEHDRHMVGHELNTDDQQPSLSDVRKVLQELKSASSTSSEGEKERASSDITCERERKENTTLSIPNNCHDEETGTSNELNQPDEDIRTVHDERSENTMSSIPNNCRDEGMSTSNELNQPGEDTRMVPDESTTLTILNNCHDEKMGTSNELNQPDEDTHMVHNERKENTTLTIPNNCHDEEMGTSNKLNQPDEDTHMVQDENATTSRGLASWRRLAMRTKSLNHVLSSASDEGGATCDGQDNC